MDTLHEKVPDLLLPQGINWYQSSMLHVLKHFSFVDFKLHPIY